MLNNMEQNHVSGLLYQKNEIRHQIDDESHSDLDELEIDSQDGGHLRESEQ